MEKNTRMHSITEVLQKNTMFVALILVAIVFEIAIQAMGRGSLFSPANINNLIMQNAYVVILATGMLLCILTGGNIDLSVGSVVALVGAVGGTLIVNLKWDLLPAIIVCLLVGIAIGAWHGFWIAYVRIPPFIVTLAGMLIWRGVALLILNGLTISPFPTAFTQMFNGHFPGDSASNLTVSLIVGALVCAIIIAFSVFSQLRRKKKGYEMEGNFKTIAMLCFISVIVMALSFLLGNNEGMPVILILLAIVVMAYSFLTSKTVPGRYLYAMGGNEKTTKLSGINTNKVLFFAYTNMSFLSAVAALVCMARFNSASPQAGTSYELDAIGACFVGGASAYGGIGTVGGVVIGAIFFGVLNNGMSISGIDSNWQKVVKGLVLLAAVAFDVVSKKRSRGLG